MPREYPDRPLPGVGGVVFVEGSVVLVRRKFAPLAGQWSLPGGAIEVGETLEEALRRELREETGLETRVGPLIELFDRITCDAEGRVQYHFVLADYLCHHVSGTPAPGSDALELALADPADLGRFSLTPEATRVVCRGAELARHSD